MKKSPLYKGIGKYAKKTKGDRGFKMKSPIKFMGAATGAATGAIGGGGMMAIPTPNSQDPRFRK